MSDIDLVRVATYRPPRPATDGGVKPRQQTVVRCFGCGETYPDLETYWEDDRCGDTGEAIGSGSA